MLTGSCHCGAVRFEVDGEVRKVIECNCSHCSSKGLLLAFFPRDALNVKQGADHVATYTFNKHVIQHRFCPTCGVQPFSIGTMPDGTAMAAVNTRCLDDFDPGSVERRHVDGRDL